MTDVLRLAQTKDDETWGYPKIDVVAFNFDGEGTALLRIHPKDGPSFLQTCFGEDLVTLLEGSAGDGVRGYVELVCNGGT